MTGHLLVRGMLVGLLAGILAFGFAKTFGEPQIDKAIAFEDQMAQMHGDAPEEELVSREVQSTFGLFTGVVVYSVSLGGILPWCSPTPWAASARSAPVAWQRCWHWRRL